MRLLRQWLTPRSPRPQTRLVRLGVEQLEAREIRSVAPLLSPSGPGAPAGLQDPLLAPVAAAEFVQDNGQLSRTDVIHLLDVVAGTETAVFSRSAQVSFRPATPSPQAGLTPSQLTDLQTLVNNASAWGMPGDVSNLFAKLLNNPANENYQGAPLLTSGTLSAGSADTLVQDLVGKWFYGTDLPNVATAAASNAIPDTVVYKAAQGTLFGRGGPRPNDIAQGWVPDCYFMSSLGETALQSPQTIQSMFSDNGDATYTVRFYQYDAAHSTWQPDYVTVNLQLPVLQHGGQFAFADWYQGGQPTKVNDAKAVLWPALAEKAYAQLAAEGWSRYYGTGGSGNDKTPSDWNQNSYDALANGDDVALQQITGANLCTYTYLSNATKADETTLVNAVAHGSLVLLASPGKTLANVPTNAAGAPLIMGYHVYALASADAKTDQFTLIDP
jgi:hypothetical protein